jgi:hypothetical protein
VADGLKEYAVPSGRLRIAEKEIPVVLQCIVEDRDAFFLSLGFKIYKKITADNQVKPGKRRIYQKVLPREYDLLTYGFAYGCSKAVFGESEVSVH